MASAPTGGVVLVVIAGIIVIIAGVVVAFLGVEAVVLRWLRPAHPSIPGTRLGIWRAVMHLAGAPRVPGTVVQGPAPEGLHVPTPQTPNPDLPENLPDMPASPITAPHIPHHRQPAVSAARSSITVGATATERELSIPHTQLTE